MNSAPLSTALPQITQDEAQGFIGLGVMGQAMAINLVKANRKLVVWNRSRPATEALSVLGAHAVESIDEVFQETRTVFIMLLNDSVIDEVLGRGTPAFVARIAGHTIVSMSSVAPEYSMSLAHDIQSAGGSYIESPVSGSRQPALNGSLVAMLAGDFEVVEEIRPLLAPMCRATVNCGAVGSALRMKLAVNLYLGAMLVGLSEAVHFAEAYDLNLTALQAVIDSGPMACDVTRVKLPKLITRDFSVQAATSDALASCTLIANAARAVGIASPLIDRCRELYAESVALGHSKLDLTSVLLAIEALSQKRQNK